MALEIGSRLGHYNVTALIGEGGMGQVYQATDTKLKRQVALKILPEAFSADPERLARFQREAEVLASLNHPNIAAIHGLEESDGVRALVLELVEGPTLADRIKRGPIPLDEALPIAKQIAEALEAAHEAGVIHRDLKPANIKVRDDGTVKVLDFGLAKALDPNPEGDPSQSPTLTAAATQMGVIMGTAAYMSPEQARGSTVDSRADIWSFGVVLFEMLTGKQLFTGATISDTLAAVLRAEPDWNTLPGDTPSALHRVLRRCLERDRRERLPHVGEARFLIREALTTPSPETVAAEAVTVAEWRRALPWSVAILMLAIGLLGGWIAWRGPSVESPGVQRFTISVPAADAANLNDFEIGLSPDGDHLAFIGRRANREEIHLRSLDQLTPIPLPGTQNPLTLLFSPDSEWIAFTTRQTRQLKRVALAGGAPEVICDLPTVRTAPSWSDAGDILFGAPDGLYTVPASGGVPERITEADPGAGAAAHGAPHALPGGKGVLFAVGDSVHRFNSTGNGIAVLSLETREWKLLPLRGGSPRYSPTGHVLFLRNQAGAESTQELWAVAFDVDRLEVTGEPALVLAGIDRTRISISSNGVLAYVPGAGRAGARLVWVDRSGRARPLSERRAYTHLDLSLDGTRVAVDSDRDLWIHDVDGGQRIRLTGGGGFPVWSPDGQWVNFFGGVERQGGLNRVRADGSGGLEPFTENPAAMTEPGREPWGTPLSISPDGESLAVAQRDGDIWIVPREDDPRPLLDGPFEERTPKISNDGRWLAYVSNETGQEEVYVTPYPGSGSKVSVSPGGGLSPAWSGDGRELFYRDDNRVMVDIETDPSFAAGTPRELFKGNYRGDLHGHSAWDAAPDGQHFVMIESPESVEINVVLNWFEELTRLVPTP